MFKNIRIYTIKPGDPLLNPVETLGNIEDCLKKHQFKECEKTLRVSFGWYAPFEGRPQWLSYTGNGRTMICARRDEKIIPAAAINRLVKVRVDKIEAQEGRSLHRREKMAIKDDEISKVLPTALIKTSFVYGYIDYKNGWIVMDAKSEQKAEDFITLLRASLGDLNSRPLEVASTPSNIMTSWIMGSHHDMPEGLKLGGSAVLFCPQDSANKASLAGQDLRDNEVRNLIEAGRSVKQVAVTYQDNFTCRVADDATIRGVKIDAADFDEAQGDDMDDEGHRFDTTFTVVALEVDLFFNMLINEFGGQYDEAGDNG